MDEVKDFFKELRERASSPLIGSFIISWCIINWEVVVAILFNNADTLKQNRFDFITNTVKKQFHWWDMGIFPLICATIYIFGYPYLRRKIKWYVAVHDAKGEAEILRSAGLEPVSLDNYITMVEAQKNARNSLASLINSQQEINDAKATAEAERDAAKVLSLQAQENIKLKQEEINKRIAFTDVNNINGIWEYYSDLAGVPFKVLFIMHEKLIRIGERNYDLLTYSADFDRRIISFVIKSEDGQPIVSMGSIPVLETNMLHFVLKVDDEFKALTSLGGPTGSYSLKRM